MILPNKLVMHIFEKQPIAKFIINNNKYYIDIHGSKIEDEVKATNFYKVPLVNINYNSPNEIDSVKKLLIELNKTSIYNLLDNITIRYAKNIELITNNNTIIYFGDLNKINYKIKILDTFLKEIGGIKSIYDFDYINLTYNNQIVVKKI